MHPQALRVELGRGRTIHDGNDVSTCAPRVSPHTPSRAVLAFGGMQDCTMQFPDAPFGGLRATTVTAASAALGID